MRYRNAATLLILFKPVPGETLKKTPFSGEPAVLCDEGPATSEACSDYPKEKSCSVEFVSVSLASRVSKHTGFNDREVIVFGERSHELVGHGLYRVESGINEDRADAFDQRRLNIG